MISLTEQIVGAQREITLRRQCYPGWVKSGTLDPGDAKYQILCTARRRSPASLFMAQKVILTRAKRKGGLRMFDTLITYAVAYYQAHPEALARYRASKTHEEFVDEAYQFTAWSLTTPPWNSPEMQQRLDEESHELSRAPKVAQARFFAAKNAAIVQLEYGEHE